MSGIRSSDVEWLAVCVAFCFLTDWLDSANRLPVKWWFAVLVLAFVIVIRRR